MGFYVNQNATGEPLPSVGKARILLQDDGAKQVKGDKFERGMICVVHNGMFDAAGFVYDKAEFEDFSDPSDTRFKTWLTHPNAARLAMGHAIDKGLAHELPDGQWEVE